MQCPYHPRTRVVGYCAVCGDLGCEKCLTEHEGKLYCRRDFKPIAERIERTKRRDAGLSRPERQRLVVHTLEGKIAYGTCHSLNTEAEGFYLELVDKLGHPKEKTNFFSFRELKAVFYVKSFDGRFDAEQRYRDWQPGGSPVVIEFHDAEVLRGQTLHPLHKESKRFFVIPEDPDSNNVSLLVERASLKAVYSPEEYDHRRKKELEHYFRKHFDGSHPKQEVTGDYHFAKHEYNRAIQHYRSALSDSEDDGRVRKKMAAAEYNIGVHFLKQRDYVHALVHMKRVLDKDPHHERARKKARQLQDHLDHKSGE